MSADCPLRKPQGCQQVIYRGSLKYVTHYPLRKRISADYLPRKPQVCHTLFTAEKNVSRLSTEEASSMSHTIHCGKVYQQIIYRGSLKYVTHYSLRKRISADYLPRKPQVCHTLSIAKKNVSRLSTEEATCL